MTRRKASSRKRSARRNPGPAWAGHAAYRGRSKRRLAQKRAALARLAGMGKPRAARKARRSAKTVSGRRMTMAAKKKGGSKKRASGRRSARRAGTTKLTKGQRTARKAAATRARHKAERSARAKKAARTRAARKGGGKRAARKGGGKRAARKGGGKRRASRRVKARRSITGRSKGARARRRVSSSYRRAWGGKKGRSVRRGLRRSARHHGVRKGHFPAKARRSYRRIAGRMRAPLKRAFRRARVRGVYRRAGHALRRRGRTSVQRRSALRGVWGLPRRNPWGDVKATVTTALVFYGGYRGAKVLGALVEGFVRDKWGTNETVKKALDVGGGAAVPTGFAALGFIARRFCAKKLGAAHAACKVLDALIIGFVVAAVERVVTAYVLPQLEGSASAWAKRLAAGLKGHEAVSAYAGYGAYHADTLPRPQTSQPLQLPAPSAIGNYTFGAAEGGGQVYAAPAGYGGGAYGDVPQAYAGYLPAQVQAQGEYIAQPGPQPIAGMGLAGGNYQCPHCGAMGEAPAGAPVFACWRCRQAVSGLGDGQTDTPAESVVGPLRRPGGIFAESIFGSCPAVA